MSEADDADLEVLDEALMAMRRFLQAPRTVPDVDRRVELSTLMVLHALTASAPATVVEVAERVGVAHSTASRLVQRAVEAGMVTRRADTDPRRAALTPTAAGSALHARARAFRHAQLRDRLRGWTRQEVSAFSRAMRRFAQPPSEP